MKFLCNAYSFDDVSLVPQYSEVLPKDVDISSYLGSEYRGVTLRTPIMSAAMDTVTEHTMAANMAVCGGVGIIHKNMSIMDQASQVTMAKLHPFKKTGQELLSFTSGGLFVGAAVSPASSFEERLDALYQVGVDMLVIDTAHGHSLGVIECVKHAREKYKNLLIVAGNVSNPDAIFDLYAAGVDAVKIGQGSGGICTTRVVAGVGIPQFTAIEQCAVAARKYGISVIADGGIRYSGDVVKAMAAGASAVMLGGMLAGTEESAGDVITHNGKKYKSYRGMGSIGAMKSGSADRYGQKASDEKLVPEGVEAAVPISQDLRSVLGQLEGGLRSGMGYLGAVNVKALQENASYVTVTQSGIVESHVHNVTVVKKAPNYIP